MVRARGLGGLGGLDVNVLHLALVDKLDGHLTRVRVMGKVRRKGLGWSEG